MDAQTLIKHANQHKKWLEEVFINPFGYMINGNRYFLTLYKRNQKLKGYAVVTEGTFDSKDALEAFETLIIYTAFFNNFSSIGEERAKISPDYFYVPVQEMRKHESQDRRFLLGLEILEELGQLQEKFVDRVNEYTRYYDDHILKTNTINDSDLIKLMEVLSHVNRLQYLIGKKFVNSFEELKELEKFMKKLGVFSRLPKENKRFLTELLSGKKVTVKTLKVLDIEKEVEHLPIAEQIEILVREFEKAGWEKLPRYKQDLRYPKY